MKKLLLIITLLLGLCSASVSRAYIGDLDGQFMAGVDTRIDFRPFFVGADVRTVIRKTLIGEEDKVVGFAPDRVDFKTSVGFLIGTTEIEYAHTCYHRVISTADLSYYADNVNPADTDTIGIKITF